MPLNENHRVPVRTLEDFDKLNDKEVIEGYLSGLGGWPCGDNHSRDYWHGWRNGMMDAGLAEPDRAQQEIAFLTAHRKWHKILN